MKKMKSRSASEMRSNTSESSLEKPKADRSFIISRKAMIACKLLYNEMWPAIFSNSPCNVRASTPDTATSNSSKSNRKGEKTTCASTISAVIASITDVTSKKFAYSLVISILDVSYMRYKTSQILFSRVLTTSTNLISYMDKRQ